MDMVATKQVKRDLTCLISFLYLNSLEFMPSKDKARLTAIPKYYKDFNEKS